MHARSLVIAAAILAMSFATAGARDLTLVVAAPSQTAVRQVFAKPFTDATAIPASLITWGGDIDTLRSQAKTPDNAWDMVMVNSEDLGSGCSENLFEKLDWSAIGGKDHYLPQAVSDCGVGAGVASLALAWDRDKSATPPTWADFWDVTKFPGKRGLHKGVRGNLEFALIADGVTPGDVYKVLATSDGVDRAFRKLDQLKPYIVWWNDDAEAARILASGDVLMTSAFAPQIAQVNRTAHRNFGIQWAASLYEVQSWAILKGSPNLREATQFLYFAGTPAIEGRLVGQFGEGGLAKGANDGLPGDLAQLSPTAPANLNAAVRVDVGFWHDNQAKLKQRFDTWLAAH
ncbi:MAG TPA: extracellular solute-binding protein [Acetobacteraceae bacterium]|jgi:putative spermidine/putrescine transport system substrate-binding protein|nr:extracellular solute-binding protein [Acetobacteraceae bacterium]